MSPDPNDHATNSSAAPVPPSDADVLRDALVRLRLFLDDAVNGPEPLVSSGLLADFRAAWPQIRAAFTTVDQAIASGNYSTKLSEVGLTGSALRLKVAGLLRAGSRLMRGGAAFLRRNARHFLSWGNTILGSLAEAIPGAEVIKEFKECVDHDLDEQDLPGTAPMPSTQPAAT
jgi:hypothetical protein